jgi:hypothetical protein
MDRFESTIFPIGYLKKGAWGKRDLKAGRTRKLFWEILIFKQAV